MLCVCIFSFVQVGRVPLALHLLFLVIFLHSSIEVPKLLYIAKVALLVSVLRGREGGMEEMRGLKGRSIY